MPRAVGYLYCACTPCPSCTGCVCQRTNPIRLEMATRGPLHPRLDLRQTAKILDRMRSSDRLGHLLLLLLELLRELLLWRRA